MICSSRQTKKTGAALILVIAMIAVLTPVVLYFNNTSKGRLRIARTVAGRTQAKALARGGLFLALYTLGRDNRRFFFLPSDNPFKHSNELVTTDFDKELLWFDESATHPKDFEGGTISVKISDCSSRISLNTADIHLIAGGIQSSAMTVTVTSEIFKEEDEVDLSREMAAAIIDWRDKDESEYPQIGAESAWYSKQTPQRNSKNDYFESFSELKLLRYFEEVDLKEWRKKDIFTLAGTNGRINANTASPDVLRAIPGIYGSGVEHTLVKEIIENRPYRSLNELKNRIGAVSSTAWSGAGRYFDISGKRFRLTVKGRANDVDATITVIIEKRGSQFATISWKEY